MRERIIFFIELGIFLRKNIDLELLQCSPCQESYCSNSKKKIRDGEAIGGVFFVCLLSIIGFREPIGDALSKLNYISNKRPQKPHE